MAESKFRPAVVVSNNNYNTNQADVIICAITSRLDKKEYGIVIDEKNLKDGHLPIKSMIRADKLMQIERGIIAKPFAKLDDRTFDLLVKEIIKLVKRR
jgi:mRNA-degrading endonuclease toxin of MazEF toxin-antitoxin module